MSTRGDPGGARLSGRGGDGRAVQSLRRVALGVEALVSRPDGLARRGRPGDDATQVAPVPGPEVPGGPPRPAVVGDEGAGQVAVVVLAEARRAEARRADEGRLGQEDDVPVRVVLPVARRAPVHVPAEGRLGRVAPRAVAGVQVPLERGDAERLATLAPAAEARGLGDVGRRRPAAAAPGDAAQGEPRVGRRLGSFRTSVPRRRPAGSGPGVRGRPLPRGPAAPPPAPPTPPPPVSGRV